MDRKQKRPGNRRRNPNFSPPRNVRLGRTYSALDEIAPTPVVLLGMPCARNAYIGRNSGKPIIAVFTEEPPCAVCMEVLHALGTMDPQPWPEAPLKCEEHLCDHCNELHKHWEIDAPDIPGFTIITRHKCVFWFAIHDDVLRLVPAPESCSDCTTMVKSFGRLKGVTLAPQIAVQLRRQQQQHRY